MFTVYRNPIDYPGKWVLRGWEIVQGQPEPIPHALHHIADSLEAIRSIIPPGYINIGRMPEDDEAVYEVWI